MAFNAAPEADSSRNMPQVEIAKRRKIAYCKKQS